MPKLIAFSEPGYSATSQEFRSNDPDLTLNGDDFIIKSAIVLSGSWTLYDDVLSAGTSISLSEQGIPKHSAFLLTIFFGSGIIARRKREKSPTIRNSNSPINLPN